jgi:hypothetical protein
MLALIGRAYTIFYSIGQGVVAAYTGLQHNTAAAGRAEYNDHHYTLICIFDDSPAQGLPSRGLILPYI